jgi:hypothetical protein
MFTERTSYRALGGSSKQKGGMNMAIISTDVSARLRLTDNRSKTLATYSDIEPASTADEVETFVNAFSSLRMSPAISTYVIVESELTDDGE